jgi:hypothetical protein
VPIVSKFESLNLLQPSGPVIGPTEIDLSLPFIDVGLHVIAKCLFSFFTVLRVLVGIYIRLLKRKAC